MILQVDKGQITPAASGKIIVDGSGIRLTDLYGDLPIAEINVQGGGPVASVLRLIDEPPLTLIRKLGTDLANVGGNADMDVALRFPLLDDLKLEEVEVVADAGLSGVSLDYPVSDALVLDVTSDSLNLRANTSQMSLSGPVRLDGVDSELDWTEVYSGANSGTRMDLKSTANGEVLAAFGLSDLPVSGPIPFELALHQAGSTVSAIKIAADLEATELSLPELSWRKPKGKRGKLELELADGDTLAIERVRLETADAIVDGRIDLDAEGAFASAEFRRLTLKDTFDVAGKLNRTSGNHYVAIIAGEYVDVSAVRERRRSELPSDGSEHLSVDATFDLDQLRLRDDIVLSNASGSIGSAADGAVNARMRGDLSGRAGILANYSGNPDRGGKLKIESKNAGQVLETIGLYEGASGGNMVVNADVGAAGNVDGTLQVDNLRVRSEATFRNVLRSGGLDEVESSVESGGIEFSKVWVPFRITDDEITLTDAIAAGSALALKLNGTIDQANGDLNLRGVLSPAYGVTGALSNVPLLGEILSGGRGEGIVAMTFTLKGKSENPDLSVNPLSLLTPGFLRNVFEGEENETSEGFRRLTQDPDR